MRQRKEKENNREMEQVQMKMCVHNDCDGENY